MSQPASPYPPKKLLDQYRDALRLKHYSPRTEKTYVTWVKSYILFHHKRHPKDMGLPEIRQFMIHLVSDKKVSTSTQNQALSPILFLYRQVLSILTSLIVAGSPCVPCSMAERPARLTGCCNLRSEI